MMEVEENDQVEEFSGLQEPMTTGNPDTDSEQTNNDVADDEEISTPPEGEIQPPVKTQYTPEELTEIIKSDAEVDVSRLSPEGMALMKAMQRGFTPKLEEAASIRKEFEKLRQQFEEAKPVKQPETIEEAYDQNPQEVLQYVDSEIQRLIQDGSDPRQIEQYRTLKQDLVLREVNNLRTKAQTQEKVQTVLQKIQQIVPDIQTKQESLAKFAYDVLGYTPEELAKDTNPVISGDAAVRAVARINAAYDAFNAGKTVQTKQKPKQPTNVEEPGQSFTPKQTDPRAELKAKAMRGEASWSDYFMALEE